MNAVAELKSSARPRPLPTPEPLPTAKPRTFADLWERLGRVPLDRILMDPPPGTATEADLATPKGRLCELVDGVLVQKPMGMPESILGVTVVGLLAAFAAQHDLGVVSGQDGTFRVRPGKARGPDGTFTSWARYPVGANDAVARYVPELAVEVLSPSNTVEEMSLKRQDYFAVGVQLVWEVERELRQVTVYTAPDDPVILRAGDTLTGGDVLPGFAVPLERLFEEPRPRTPSNG